MRVPLQRNNFRCPPDGSKSPQATASMSAGVAAMGGAASPGKYHADFPARQRKRLQVGTTNLSKCGSSVEVGDAPSPGAIELETSVALDRIGETSVAAMKATLVSPQRRDPAKYRSNDSGKAVRPLALRTEARRLSALSPSNSSRSTDESREASGGSRTPRPQQAALPELHLGNNFHEDTVADKCETPKMNMEKVLLAHNRAKLYDVFMEKYGSMRAVFRAFDNDGNGMISAQRFQDMVEVSEVDLTPHETRALYKTADVNGDNTVAFHEFVQMFAPSVADAESKALASAYSPLKDPFGPARDPSSSVAVKYRSPLELSPRSRRRMKQLRKQVTDELRRKHGLAIGVRGGKPEQLLAYAFKNVDLDNDGFLSYSEVEHALGRGFLQLEDTIPANEMREMLQLMDRNGDEQISLREFVHYFAVGERDVATDLIDNARKKELAALHVKRTVELTPRDLVDPLFVQQKNAMLQQEYLLDTVETTEASPAMCLPEQLCKRTAAIVHAGSGASSPAEKRRGHFAAFTRESKSALSPSASSLQLEMDRRPATSCGPVVAVLSPVSPDRFYHRRHERTDWTRAGVGGNGIASDTGLYQPPQERFITTNSELYSPPYRAPPSAKRDDMDDSFLMMRDGKPSSSIEEDARRARRTARYERTQNLLQEYEEAHAQQERLKDWKSRANIRKVAGERFSYLDRLQDREQRVASREDRMQRRHGGASFLRMWAGSAESQFNTAAFTGSGSNNLCNIGGTP
jgi:Ca2+-binding EF-hand superfamily protein